MSRNYSRAAADGARKKRRRNSLIISTVAVAIIITLLVTEQVALLYLIATLGVVALLLVVAFSDLQGVRETAAAVPVPADDSAAIGDRSGGPRVTTATYAANAPRRPVSAANVDKGWVGSSPRSGIHNGSRRCHTRPASPSSGAMRCARRRSSTSVLWYSAVCQMSTQRRKRCPSSTSHNSPVGENARP